MRARGQRNARKRLTCIHSARLRGKRHQKKVDMYSQCALEKGEGREGREGALLSYTILTVRAELAMGSGN